MSTLAQLATNVPSLQVLTDGYSLEADQRGYYGTIRFWFLNADLTAFTTTVGGLPQTINIFGTSVTRLIPLIHPYIIGGNCYADSVHIYPPEGCVAGLDLSGRGISFSDYFADVHFSTPTYPVETGSSPTVTADFQGGAEMVTRPQSAYKFADGTRLAHDVGIPVQVVDFSLTMHKLPALNQDLYFSLAGCVNSTPFFGRPTGTVLYKGPGISGQFFIAGFPSFDVAHGFQFRAIPHNQIMRPDGASFDYPVQVSDGTTQLIPSADLNQLLGM